MTRVKLILSILGINFSRYSEMFFPYFFPRKKGFDTLCNLSPEMWNPVFWQNYGKKITDLSSVELLAVKNLSPLSYIRNIKIILTLKYVPGNDI